MRYLKITKKKFSSYCFQIANGLKEKHLGNDLVCRIFFYFLKKLISNYIFI